MTPLFRKFLGINWLLVAVVALLLVFGVYSLRAVTGFLPGENLSSKWNDQVMWIGLGVVAFFVGSLVDYRWIRWGAPPMYLVGLALLLMTNVELSGAESWIKLPGLPQFQPSQLAIVSGVLLLAVILGELPKVHRIFESSLVRIIIAGPVAALPCLIILLEPDFGSSVVWIFVFMVMLVVGGILFRYVIVLIQLGLIALPVLYFFGLKDYQKERIETWLNMLNDRPVDEQGAAWVPKHNMIAIGSAGFDGKVLWEEGNEELTVRRGGGVVRQALSLGVNLFKNLFKSPRGMQTSEGQRTETKDGKRLVSEMGFVPPNVAINDFIFVTIAERHGFIGATALLAMFAILLLLLLYMGYHSRDRLGRLIVGGFVAQLFFHVFMNIGMCILLVPITGLPLPFISYGGTFVLTLLFMLGMCQSVWVHRNVVVEDKKKREGKGREAEEADVIRPGLAGAGARI